MAAHYDIIIAGGGLGGLICGATLSKEGFRVCVLEKNMLLGGCLQSFRRKGVLLDTGFHYVGCLDEGQILHQYFSYLGIMDKLKLHRLDEDAFDIIHIADKEYRHAIGHERFTETLVEKFPRERENIRRMVSRFKEIGNLINIDVLRNDKRFSLNGLPYFGTSAVAFLNECTSNADLRNAIAGTAMLSGGERDTSSLYIFGMILNSNIESSYRFTDGSQQVADLLADVIRQNGGEVRTRAEVTRFVVANDRIEAVEINAEELLPGKHFISNMHPARTMELTDKCSLLKRAYLSRISSLPVSWGFFSVSVVFKPNSFPYQNKNYFYHDDNDVWFDKNYNFNEKKKIFLSFSPANESNFAPSAHLLVPMYWHEVAQWANTSVEKRGDAYREFKQRRTEQLIDYIDRRHAGFKSAIAACYASTPLTYRDYTATKEGSAYGYVKDFHHPTVSLMPARTRLPNLFLTGQNNNVHGMIGVMLTAMYTCAEFVDMGYLARKIGNI